MSRGHSCHEFPLYTTIFIWPRLKRTSGKFGEKEFVIQSGKADAYLDSILAEAGGGALLEVGGQVLVDVFEDEVEGHLTLPTRTVANVQQSVEKK